MRTLYGSLPLVLWAMLSGAGASADVRLAAPFTDNLVLQRARPVAIWGTAEPGETVKVTFAGASVSATADALGKWKAHLPAQKESAEGRELTVTGKNLVTLKNVVVGDVWLCSGQSNMAMGLGGCLGDADDIAAADLPLIRQLTITPKSAAAPAAEISLAAPWTPASPQTAGSFTAVGFYFARKVHEETGVPIGLIHASWSSTPIETWLAPEGVAAVPELSHADAIARKLAAGAAAGQAQDHAAELRSLYVRVFSDLYTGYGVSDDPAGMFAVHAAFHAMIRPLVPYGLKGVLWYQGEANGGDGEPSIWSQRRAARARYEAVTDTPERDLYFHKMHALIGGWRTLWNQPEMPFYFVQLANWQEPNEQPAGDDCWTHVRAAQVRSLEIPNTGMAVALDVGDAKNIHPVNKYDVGLRLALWALAKDYGKPDRAYSGPLYRKLELADGKARLTFDHVGGGLMVGKKDGRAPAVEDKGGRLARFAIAGADRIWHWAEARIEGEAVVIWSDKVPAPVAVRYAWSMNPAGANLYNAEGLPASPFRTDDW